MSVSLECLEFTIDKKLAIWTDAMWSSSFKHLILTVNRVSNIIPQTLHFLGKNVLNFLLSNWAIDKTKPVRLIKPTNEYNAVIIWSPACLIKESFHIISAHWLSMFAFLVHVQRLPRPSRLMHYKNSLRTRINKNKNKNKKRRHEICGCHDQRQLTTPLPSLSHHSLWDLHEIILSDIILPTCPADKWSGTPSSTVISSFITSKMARIGEHFETSCSPQSSLNSNLFPWGW